MNSLVKRLSFLLQVPRRMLNIVSASKGLCAGAIMLRNNNDHIEMDVGYLSSSGKGLNISEFMDSWDEMIVYGSYILVVEKETVYFRLLNEGNMEFLCTSHHKYDISIMRLDYGEGLCLSFHIIILKTPLINQPT